MSRPACLLAILALFAGCGEATTPQHATAVAPSESTSASVYATALANPARTDADRERDVHRKPGAVLEFFGIDRGMNVLDMFSGGGYYAEIVAYVVGPQGSVDAHSNSAYTEFVGAEVEARYADDRLANVRPLMAENNELDLAPESYDAILMVLAYHDIYYVAPEDGWPRIDGPTLVSEFYEGLRPGGVLGVVDHYAAAGSPPGTGHTLHRIDPDIVIAELESAGFVLDGQSDILRNMDDDHSLNMAAPDIRGRTDRFVLRFVKPE